MSDAAVEAARMKEIREYWARPWTTVWAGTPSDLLVNVGRAYKDIGDLLTTVRDLTARLASAEGERNAAQGALQYLGEEMVAELVAERDTLKAAVEQARQENEELRTMNQRVVNLNSALVEDLGTAWVIEKMKTPEYLTVPFSSFQWTTDINKAIRFPRYEDAEMVARGMPLHYERVVKHLWIDVTSAAGGRRE